MQARALTASFDRLSAGRIRAVALSAVVLGAMVAAPAGVLAKAPTTGSTPWIALASVNGLSAASVQPSLGSSVTFSSSYPSSVKNPRIEVVCMQGGSLVYGAAGAVTDTFLLGGGGSTWLTVGGPADCTANLFYYSLHAGSQTYNWLASTTFSAGG